MKPSARMSRSPKGPYRSSLPTLALGCALAATALSFGSAVQAGENAWLEEAKQFVPPGYALGQLIRIDPAASIAHVAVFPANAVEPQSLGNAFDGGHVLRVHLLEGPDGYKVVDGAMDGLAPRAEPTTENEMLWAERQEELYARAEQGPPGLMPCSLVSAWSLDDSEDGKAVYAAPDDASTVLGRLASASKSIGTETAPQSRRDDAFAITGYQNGWFQIGIADDDSPEDGPKSHDGNGWIKADQVGTALADTSMPVPRLLQYPNISAGAIEPLPEAADGDGDLAIEHFPVQLNACSANWVLATTNDGQKGWWRGTCSDPFLKCGE